MKTLSPRRRRTGAFLVLFLFCLLAASCGKPRGAVSGVVNYQGKPLKSGTVSFIPEQGSAIDSLIDSEGNYRVENVPVGNAKITVREGGTTDSGSLKAVKSPRSPEEMRKAMMPRLAKDSKFPKVYGDPETSGQTYTVQPGPQKHDIDLK